jgi:uncharacterized coiled-coil DUF342 family protein
MNEELINNEIERLNEERRAEARNQVRLIITTIADKQKTIKQLNEQIAQLRVQLSQVTITPVDAAEILGSGKEA